MSSCEFWNASNAFGIRSAVDFWANVLQSRCFQFRSRSFVVQDPTLERWGVAGQAPHFSGVRSITRCAGAGRPLVSIRRPQRRLLNQRPACPRRCTSTHGGPMTRQSHILIVLLVFTLALAACGQPAPTPEPTATPAPPPTATPAPLPTDAPAPEPTPMAAPQAAEDSALPEHLLAPAPAGLLQGPGRRASTQKPWVRLHAAKDYVDMAAILEAYPDIAGDLQPDAVATAPAPGPGERRQGPVPGLHRDPGGRADRRRQAVHREPLLRHQPQDHRPLPALPGAGRRPRQQR